MTMHRYLFLLLIAFILPAAAMAQEEKGSIADQWDALLDKHTERGTIDGIDLVAIDYEAIAKDPQWRQLLDDLETAPVPSSREGKLAYWTNVYNILAVKVVLKAYPADSIKDAGPWIGTVWKIDAGYAAGEMRTLHEVEHEILRPMGEPLVHGAIVCASLSCPDLRLEAFRADKVTEQMEDQMRRFLANEEKGARIEDGDLYLSSIFDWFAEDFEETHGSVKEFAKEYAPGQISRQINEDTSVYYMDYDWSLNDTKRLANR